MRIETFEDKLGCSLEDCPELHFVQSREGDAQTYSAVSHHRVDLVESLAAFLDLGYRNAKFLGQFFLFVAGLRHELVQRRIEQTEGN